MGELFGGRSATWPTFSRSTSVRTRTDLQYSHTVCTLADQRKAIFAPQLGQFATGWVIVPRAPRQSLDDAKWTRILCLFHEPPPTGPRTAARDATQSPIAGAARSKTNSGTGNRIQGMYGRRGATRTKGTGR